MSDRRRAAVTLRVRAVREGFYANDLKRVDDVFDLVDVQHFAPLWMVRVPSATPLFKVSIKHVPLRRLFRPVEPEGPFSGGREDWDLWD